MLLESPSLARAPRAPRRHRRTSRARFARARGARFRTPRSAGATGSSRTASRSRFRRRGATAAYAPWVRDVLLAGSYGPQLTSTPRQIGAPALWGPALDTAGQGMKIGIIDSGVDPSHPFFDPAGYTMPPGFPKGQQRSRPPRSSSRAPFAPERETASARVAFIGADISHGTHVAGIAAGNARTQDRGPHGSPASRRARTSGTTRSSSRPTRGSARTRTRPRSWPRSRRPSRDGMDVINFSGGEPEIEPAGTSSRGRSMQRPQPASCRSSQRETTTTSGRRLGLLAGELRRERSRWARWR